MRWVTSRKSTFCLQTVFEVPPEHATSRSSDSQYSQCFDERTGRWATVNPPLPFHNNAGREERISRILDAQHEQEIFEESLEDLQHAKI